MMRALWAGVTGLQAHQIAMDVESNNIANVNTTGYKYSRANFSNLLSQTVSIATAPQGELGGKNSMQIGLGTTISTVTKIFEQGSIETTDKDTDLAISGDGFFVVSPDGGTTYKYTRNGDFSFDANGNFVDSNGYIIQGWLRDQETGQIDTTSPISNILITPGYTTPANATSIVSIKANLDSGTSVGTNKTSIYSLDSKSGWVDADNDGIMDAAEVHNEDDNADTIFNNNTEVYERGVDFGVLFDSDGEALSLTDGQGTWISYAQAKTERIEVEADASDVTHLTMTINGTTITTGTTGISTSTYSTTTEKNEVVAAQIAALINAQTSVTGVTATITSGNYIVLSNDNSTGTEASTKNIKMDVDTTATSASTGFVDTQIITAYQYTYSSSPTNTSHTYDDSDVRNFRTTEELRDAMQTDARLWVNYTGDANTPDANDGVTVTVNDAGQFVISNPTGDAFTSEDGDFVDSTLTSYTRTSAELNASLAEGGITFPANTVFQDDITLPATFTGSIITNNGTYTGGDVIPAGDILSVTSTIPQGSTMADVSGVPTSLIIGTNFLTEDDQSLYLTVTGLTNSKNNISTNDSFTTSMSSIQGTLTSGTATRSTQSLYMASLASSTDIYDSLGSKHTIRFQYTKTGFTETGGTEWSVTVTVPEPGDINLGEEPKNVVTGSIRFNSDGSLATYTPRNLTYTANNGSTANQIVQLNFGSVGQLDGITSFDKDSSTTNINQDGYTGGDLSGLSVDETGTIIGSFTNGRSFALAQVAMSTFTNNGGLESDGGNCYIQTSNSGDPVFGQAGTGGKGSVQSSSLEMSNVDLSRSLTQLIVIQRGYQANSKTITTADEMLNTLLQLK
ncbi:flagellar hook protein FlgE [Sulfurospirillum deleyianum]|uniref:Flagellar hook protein FlgE n=1 Tax=Sulfurospirillum deleyianum (strain ATCC 51133 / DSM 6946 / 5175) TaxID=525898 RepID=D1B5D3_SULD5|nr:flagellar hook protein FlgE [Sulfurospirillum deleyianum]ACZ13303.1 flagellar hook protein FlgE [Sulfurospirillum deleyianum DSM 6946]